MRQMISCYNSQAFAPDEGAMSKDIIFATRECVLGEVLVARSAVGVCAILIGSEAEDLKSDLAMRFTGSKLIANEPQLRDDLSKVVADPLSSRSREAESAELIIGREAAGYDRWAELMWPAVEVVAARWRAGRGRGHSTVR